MPKGKQIVMEREIPTLKDSQMPKDLVIVRQIRKDSLKLRVKQIGKVKVTLIEKQIGKLTPKD